MRYLVAGRTRPEIVKSGSHHPLLTPDAQLLVAWLVVDDEGLAQGANDDVVKSPERQALTLLDKLALLS